MKLFKAFSKNIKATYRLKKRYYRITSIVGSASVAVGVGIMMLLVFNVAPILGFDLDSKISSNGGETIAIFVVIIMGFAACIYIGVLLVAGSFSFVMHKLGKFTKSEAINYALYSDYPEYWFDKKP